jgi:hypothetical protein
MVAGVWVLFYCDACFMFYHDVGLRVYTKVSFICNSRLLNLYVCGSLSPQHGASSGCGWRNGLRLWRVAVNILNK